MFTSLGYTSAGCFAAGKDSVLLQLVPVLQFLWPLVCNWLCLFASLSLILKRRLSSNVKLALRKAIKLGLSNASLTAVCSSGG
jgi:hypothetical protein